jgi:secreted Zn-dependent insulinase-like peptidase
MKEYKKAPTRLISHLIGHEAQGSILYYLKFKGNDLGRYV